MQKLTRPPAVEFYASVFDEPSRPLWVDGQRCREVVRRGAYDSFVRNPKRWPSIWYNHARGQIACVSPLSLEVDDYGLLVKIEFRDFGRWLEGWRLVHNIRHGEISGCSVCISDCDRRWNGRHIDGLPVNEITTFYSLREISILRLPKEPAFPGTFCRVVKEHETVNRLDRRIMQLEKTQCRV